MTGRRPSAFEEGRSDVVAAVLVPIDGVTRMPVRSGVEASLWDVDAGAPRPPRLVRNLQGHLVLLNCEVDGPVTFRVDPTRAGYRGPFLVTLEPEVPVKGHVIRLEPRPEYAFPGTTTLVRGLVVRTWAGEDEPVGGLTVSAEPEPGAADRQFPATTDERGMFALTVRLKRGGIDQPAEPVPTVLRFAKPGLPERQLDVLLDRGRTHVFTEPVDLDGSNRPPFSARPEHEDPDTRRDRRDQRPRDEALGP